MGEYFKGSEQYRQRMRNLRELARRLDRAEDKRYSFWTEYRKQAAWFGWVILSLHAAEDRTVEAANEQYNTACQSLLGSSAGRIVFSEYCAAVADSRNDPNSAEACRGWSERLVLEQMEELGQVVLGDLQRIR